jgi:hypothetical protein
MFSTDGGRQVAKLLCMQQGSKTLYGMEAQEHDSMVAWMHEGIDAWMHEGMVAWGRG